MLVCCLLDTLHRRLLLYVHSTFFLNHKIKVFLVSVTKWSFCFLSLLWGSGYFHDRRAEEILQRNEEARLKETSKTHPKAKSKHSCKRIVPPKITFLSICPSRTVLSLTAYMQKWWWDDPFKPSFLVFLEKHASLIVHLLIHSRTKFKDSSLTL